MEVGHTHDVTVVGAANENGFIVALSKTPRSPCRVPLLDPETWTCTQLPALRRSIEESATMILKLLQDRKSGQKPETETTNA